MYYEIRAGLPTGLRPVREMDLGNGLFPLQQWYCTLSQEESHHSDLSKALHEVT